MEAPTFITELVSYHHRLAQRDTATIELVVIHCTELPGMAEARDYAERIHDREAGTGYCGHYYVDRDGTLYRYVEDDRIAHHVRGKNTRSLGIELVNRGRYPHWYHRDHQVPTEPYPDDQIRSLITLVNTLRATHSSIMVVAGHEDLDRARVPAADDPGKEVARKVDPGPLFPWTDLLVATGLPRLRG